MKPIHLCALAGSTALFGFGAFQTALPPSLARDFDRLVSASTVRLVVRIRVIGEAPNEYQIALAKPNRYRIAGPDGFVLCDGKTVYTYNQAKNTYFEAPASDGDLANLAKRPELFGWAPFFQKDPAAGVVSARQTGTRSIEGNLSTEVDVSMKTVGVHGTLFLDQKSGVTRGYSLSSGGKEYLALAAQVVVGTDAAPATEYAFAVPDGAKKTEAPKPDDATFANVQTILTNSCMPCHGAQQRAGGVDLSSYAGVTQSVTRGNGAASRLVTVLRTQGPGRMPQGRAPLPEDQITQIQKWIDAGAQNN